MTHAFEVAKAFLPTVEGENHAFPRRQPLLRQILAPQHHGRHVGGDVYKRQGRLRAAQSLRQKKTKRRKMMEFESKMQYTDKKKNKGGILEMFEKLPAQALAYACLLYTSRCV